MTECCSREAEAVYCLVMGCELNTPIAGARCRVRPKRRVTENCSPRRCATPRHAADGELQIRELLDFLNHFSAICSPTRTEWWCWNKSPGKQDASWHTTRHSLNLYTWPCLALQTLIGIPSLLLTYTVRASNFTWYILIYWHFTTEPCLLKST